MANEPGRIRRALVRVINDENLDLYLLGTVALVFTVLGITGISDVKTTSAVVVALLALLALSQIRSRRLIEQIRTESRGGATALFARDWPADLAQRRAQARDILFVGLTMARIQSIQSDLTAILEAGGQVRLIIMDPTDEQLMETASRRIARSLGQSQGMLRARIMNTLGELTTLRERTAGRLMLRVSSAIPSAGFTCFDTASPRGLVYVQHYEFQQGREAPIFTLRPSDGDWYRHFLAEAERLWDAGTDWPLSPADAAARARRPVFSDRFGPERDAAIEETTDLFVTGTARNSLLNANFEQLKKKLLDGSRMRFLLADPDSSAIGTAADRYYAERSPDIVRERVRHSLRLLSELKTSTGGDLSVRLVQHSLTVIVIATEAALFAECFLYQQQGTLKFVLGAGDGGHDRFLAEAEKLWEKAKPYEL